MNDVKFHHYGLAVSQFDEALIFHRNLGYICSTPVIDKEQDVELILCVADKYPTVELVKPINNNSPIITYLRENNEIIYHVCYEVTKPKDTIQILMKKNRAICVREPRPAIIFDNRLVSFYYVKNVGLIEILEK